MKLDTIAIEQGGCAELHANSALPLVLLADDNRIVCKVIAKILEACALRIQRADRGDDALEALMAGDFALALINAHLPVMDGLSIVKHYRFAAVGRKRVPILGLVGARTAGQIGACIDAGMDGCLAKPIEPTQLLEVVKSFVGTRVASERPPVTASLQVEGQESETPAINMRVLRDLEQLGGRRFVEDVVSQFVADANRILPELALSISRADVQSSRDLLHALRSCAANVGASGIFELCLSWREINLDELVERGEACLGRLEFAFEQARLSLGEFEPVETALSPEEEIAAAVSGTS
jgi:two-component system sensor histidine kinase RpfC